MFNKLEARVLSEYKRSRAAPSTFCTLIKHYFSFIEHYLIILLFSYYILLSYKSNYNDTIIMLIILLFYYNFIN
jgi:hypothetical protein